MSIKYSTLALGLFLKFVRHQHTRKWPVHPEAMCKQLARASYVTEIAVACPKIEARTARL